MLSPPKPKKSSIGCSSLARPSPRQSSPRLSPSTTSPPRRPPLVLKRRRRRGTAPPARYPAAEARRCDAQELEVPSAGPPVRPSVERQSGPKKRVLRETSLRGCKDPRRAFLPRKEGSKSPKRDRHQVWSVRREFVRPMNDNPGRQKRMLRKRRLLSKAFRPQSNLASLMGTQFALRALRLGGWSMRLASDLSKRGSLKCRCDERSPIQSVVPSGASAPKQCLPERHSSRLMGYF